MPSRKPTSRVRVDVLSLNFRSGVDLSCNINLNRAIRSNSRARLLQLIGHSSMRRYLARQPHLTVRGSLRDR